jgi:hypothetical protein
MKHFYRGTEITNLYEDIHIWRYEVNRSSLDLLERLVSICSSDPNLLHSNTRSAIHDFIEEEAFSRNLLNAQGEGLRRNLEELTLRMVGLRQIGNETRKIQIWQGALAKHAAAVMLALCIAGAVPNIGVSHPAGKEPEEDIDVDTDGLYEQYELKIFGTDSGKVDTDGDGMSDGEADHDSDGMTNLEEQRVMVKLMDAVEIGDSENVIALLDAGASANAIDRKGMPAMIRAAWHGYIETVQVLLESDADVNAKDNDGFTALMRAAENGHNEVIEILLDANADVNARSANGIVALMSAAGRGDVETVKILIDAGADVHAKDNDGYTSLIHAAEHGHAETVKVLLDAGADVHAAVINGRTALQYAELNSHYETMQLLKEAGAKE